MMWWWDDGPWLAGWFWLMPLMALAFLAAVGIGIALLVRALVGGSARGGGGGSGAGGRGWPPEQVLADRYARGEIDDEEYRRRLAGLRAARDQPPGPAAG
jgi:putative membrane protein